MTGASERAARRAVSGIVLLDKPAGLSSNRALQAVKRLFAAEKAGHTGSLDPLATGMLPVCLGAATKIAGLLLDAEKTYRAGALFGVATETGDAEGAVVAEAPAPQKTRAEVAEALAGLVGPLAQVPPMYSALKHEGQRLYALARRGETVERKARTVTILAAELVALEWPRVEFTVECSKGTYVRTLVEELAARLGTVGHVAALRRLALGPFREAQMRDLEALRALESEGFEALDVVLLPADAALAALPAVELGAEEARRVGHGQRIAAAAAWPAGRVRLYAPGPAFLGVGTVEPGGELRPQRLFV